MFGNHRAGAGHGPAGIPTGGGVTRSQSKAIMHQAATDRAMRQASGIVSGATGGKQWARTNQYHNQNR